MALTLDDIKQLSPPKKALILLGLFLLLGYFYYTYVLVQDMDKKAALLERRETLQGQIADRQRLARQKEAVEREVVGLQRELDGILTKLPLQKDIPDLLRDVEQAGKTVGIQFVLFEPRAPQPHAVPAAKPVVAEALKPSDQRGAQAPAVAGGKPTAPQQGSGAFYEEIPIQVTISGSFADTVRFFENVAQLPRIVNIKEIVMGDAKDIPWRGRVLTTQCIVKTYMFLGKKDEFPVQTDEKKK